MLATTHTPSPAGLPFTHIHKSTAKAVKPIQLAFCCIGPQVEGKKSISSHRFWLPRQKERDRDVALEFWGIGGPNMAACTETSISEARRFIFLPHKNSYQGRIQDFKFGKGGGGGGGGEFDSREYAVRFRPIQPVGPCVCVCVGGGGGGGGGGEGCCPLSADSMGGDHCQNSHPYQLWHKSNPTSIPYHTVHNN